MTAPATQARAPSDARTRYLLILGVGLIAVSVFLLATASANTAVFAEYYTALLLVNGAVALGLAVLVGYQLLTLRRKLKAGIFGSKLTVRLVLLFALMAVLPGALIYGVSVQFVAKSIESWFEGRLDRSLEAGLNLGRGTLDTLLRDLTTKAGSMALTLSEKPAAEHIAMLNALREQAGVQEAALFTTRGRALAFSGNERAGLAPDSPSADALRQVRAQHPYSAVESSVERGLQLRVLVPVNALTLAEEGRVLQLLHSVPEKFAQDADAVQVGYREYQELLLARRGLKRFYEITLTLTLLLSLLTALALAFVLSDRLSAPLGVLVEGTRAVAQGDFSQRAAVATSDELGVLTQSFNSMTLQLAETRLQAEHHREELAHAKAYLESILASLSAGVLAFDAHQRLRSGNPSAARLLGTDCAPLIGLPPQDWGRRDPTLTTLGTEIGGGFAAGGIRTWERQVERDAPGGRQVLLLRGTRLPEGAETGAVVVFDDITHLLQAQRDAAWAEVARRLAHEIKNPLTPIQLSAERLQVKLEGKLAEPEADMLRRSTQTIVKQVASLKHMVDAFSEYARTPEPSMRPLDLNEVVREVLTLYESLGSSIRLELAARLPPVVGDAAQLRQVVHNLLQNAQDALGDEHSPLIVLATAEFGDAVRLTVTDNGGGFPEHMMKRAFEPYVTSKPKGTGLGLVIVKKIVEEHGGAVAISNVAPGGARVTIDLPGATAQGAGAKAQRYHAV